MTSMSGPACRWLNVCILAASVSGSTISFSDIPGLLLRKYHNPTRSEARLDQGMCLCRFGQLQRLSDADAKGAGAEVLVDHVRCCRELVRGRSSENKSDYRCV